MSAAAASVAALPPNAATALRAAFGDAPLEDLSRLGGGLSGAALFVVKVAGDEYVVRCDLPGSPSHGLACLRIASDLGVAPRLRHVDEDRGVSIMDRIAGSQLGRAAPADPARLERLARTLRRLHDGPPFPKAGTVPEMLVQLDAHLRSRGAGLPAALVGAMCDLAAATERFAETAPCHHDLNPNNVLVAGDRIYFVDWDTARAGDPFLDLAQLGVFVCRTADERAALLRAYLGHPPSEEEQARAALARPMALGFYAAAFTFVATMSGGAPEKPPPAAVPLDELLTMLGAARERTDPALLAASLLREMEREIASPACREARRLLSR